MSSCSQCERESDNKEFQCPPKMADGRAFTDYKPRCSVFASLASTPQPLNSYELRQYMITNAEDIMSRSRKEAEQKNLCGPCVQPWNQGTMLPEESIVKCNASTCTIVKKDPFGLGQGRDYGIPTDNNFIKVAEERDARMRSQPANCCTGFEEDSKYFPLAPVHEERYAIPSGGSPF